MKMKIPNLDLDKVESCNMKRLEQLAKTDRTRLQELEKKEQEKYLATCTFMPNSSRKGQVGVSKEFVSKLSKPKIFDKYQKMKEEQELKNCTFKPKTNVNKRPRAKTARRPSIVKKLDENADKMDGPKEETEKDAKVNTDEVTK